jgi:hypothetical protein
MKYWKISHGIFTVALVFELFITGVYWGVLFPYAVINLWGKLGVYDILNPIMAHAMPVILLFTDLQFNLIVIWNAAFIPIYFFLLGIYLLMNLIYSI